MNEQENKMLQDMTIVMQGRVDPECIKHMVSRYRNNIIISTWEDTDLEGCGDLDGVRVVRSPVPVGDIGPKNTTNMMFQFNSTIAGLSACNTQYAIKMRGDEYFSNLDTVEKAVRNDNRIHCIPVFMPRHSCRPFCVGDHFLAGSRLELKTMFKSARRWWLTRPALRMPRIPAEHQIPECILGFTYLASKMGTALRMANSASLRPEHMKNYFSILPLDSLKDYRITWNNSVFWGDKRIYYNDFDPQTNGRGTITHIDQITE